MINILYLARITLQTKIIVVKSKYNFKNYTFIFTIKDNCAQIEKVIIWIY